MSSSIDRNAQRLHIRESVVHASHLVQQKNIVGHCWFENTGFGSQAHFTEITPNESLQPFDSFTYSYC